MKQINAYSAFICNHSTICFKVVLCLFLLLTSSTKSKAQSCRKPFFGVPEELVRNRHKEPEMAYGHPYTIFNKRYSDFYLQREIDSIQKTIQLDGNLKIFYSSIVNYCNTTDEPEDLPPNRSADPSELAVWAKYNAFVLLIGIEADGSPINEEVYLNRVYSAFNAMQYEGISGNSELGKLIKYANSTVCWIQAYDLYKTYKLLKEPDLQSDYDRNEWECSYRNKMRSMAWQLRKDAWGENFLDFGTVNHPTGWKKNHGVIAASAMAMCAVVLNDAGVRKIRNKWSPIKWAEKSNEGLEDLFFTGWHAITRNVPLTSDDGTAGYNEGPNYWTYTLQAFAPAMITANNMYSTHHDNNWYNDDRIANICEWYDRIRLTNGIAPTYDDSRLNDGSNIQALIKPQYDYGTDKGLDYLLPDYIVSVCQARLHGTKKATRVPEAVTRMDGSGNIILGT